MKNDADRVAAPRPETADAVAKVDAVDASRSLHRTVTDGEDDGIPLFERDDFGPGLHARALFGQDELASGEIADDEVRELLRQAWDR